MRLFTVFFLCSFATWLHAQEDCSLSGKSFKLLKRLFDQPVEVQPMQLPENSDVFDDYLYEYDCLFELSISGEKNGYLIQSKAKGRFDYFDYVVIFSPEKKVLGVSVLQYRSDHGAGICQRSWLRQFEGYQGENLQVGKNIDGVTGGTISANSMVSDIQRCHTLIMLITSY